MCNTVFIIMHVYTCIYIVHVRTCQMTIMYIAFARASNEAPCFASSVDTIDTEDIPTINTSLPSIEVVMGIKATI